jgi:hypothetical protein
MRGWSVRSRAGALVAAIVVAVGVAGCGTNTASGGGADVAGAVLSQAKQQLQESSTARISMRADNVPSANGPGVMTGEGVLDLANLQGRITYNHSAMAKPAEMLLLPDSMYAQLPEPKDGKTWATTEGMSGKAMFAGMDRDSVSEALDAFGSVVAKGATDNAAEERTFSETITVAELREQLGATDDAPVLRMLESINVTSMTVELVLTPDDRLKRMSVAYGDAMTVTFHDFGAPLGDLTPPPADQVLVQKQPLV